MARGKSEIAKDLHIPTGPGRPFRLDIETVRFLAPDIALVDGQYFSTSAEPGGHVFYVMVKQSSSWKIRAATNSSLSDDIALMTRNTRSS